jgi:hypothetical protein
MRFPASRRLAVLLAIALCPPALTGCASIFGSTRQKLTVTSDPPGARIYIGGADSGITPRTMRIRRGSAPLVMRVQSDGSDAETRTLERGVSKGGLFFDALLGLWGVLMVNFDQQVAPSITVGAFLLPFGLTTGVDALTGKLWVLKTDSVHVVLRGRAGARP